MLIYLVLSVSIAGAVAAFPDASPTTVQYLLTVPSLACLVGSFLVPALSGRLSQKTLSLGAQLLSLFGAAIYVVWPYSLPLLFAASVVMGLGYGVLSTTFPLLVSIHVPPAQQNHVTGIASGMVQFGRLFSLFLAGLLGDIRWNYVYLTYVLVLAAMCIVAPCLPPDQPIRAAQDGKSQYSGFLKNPGIWEIILADFVFGILYFITNTHISLYIESYGFGSASTTGAITSVACGVAGAAACLFAPIYRATKKRTLCLIFLLMGVGYVVIGSVVQLPAAIFGVMCSSIAAAVFTPYILARATEVSTPATAPMAVSLAVACLSVGFFLSPAISDLISTAAGGSISAVYLSAGIVSLVIFAGLFLSGSARKRQSGRTASAG